MTNGCTVKLDVFEGPLDLLLHLIKRNEVQIADIPIALITDQYLATLEQLPELNLDGAGEYLVMAATLMLIKSRLLLSAVKSLILSMVSSTNGPFPFLFSVLSVQYPSLSLALI